MEYRTIFSFLNFTRLIALCSSAIKINIQQVSPKASRWPMPMFDEDEDDNAEDDQEESDEDW